MIENAFATPVDPAVPASTATLSPTLLAGIAASVGLDVAHLDRLVQELTCFPDFRELVLTPGGYRPTLDVSADVRNATLACAVNTAWASLGQDRTAYAVCRTDRDRAILRGSGLTLHTTEERRAYLDATREAWALSDASLPATAAGRAA